MIVDALIIQREQKIYKLVDAVSKEDVYSWSDEALVAMYQKLFITQAAVCELYFQYDATDEKTIWMTPVSVVLCENDLSLSKEDEMMKLASSEVASCERYLPNFEFYMVHDNFLSVTSDNVKHLLEQFWTRYDAITNQQDALSVMGLHAPADWSKVRQRYRELAAQYHPDKGGDVGKFIEIRRAYESLKQILKI